MTVYDIKDVLINHFKTLNEFSGITFLKNNVAYPNESFTIPANKTWFEVSFLNNEADSSAMYTPNVDRYTGILQIDICCPLDKGEVEASNKVKWISRLFHRGQFLGDMSVELTNVSRSNTSSEKDHYRTTVRVTWSADIDNN